MFLRQPWLSPIRLAGWLPTLTMGGIQWIPMYHGEGCLAALALGIEGLCALASPRLRRACSSRIWPCVSLSCYLMWLMYIEPFYLYRGNITFIAGVLLLTPVLLAMSLLVRMRAWIGLLGAMVFFATWIAMMTHNACFRGGMSGFFEALVY